MRLAPRAASGCTAKLSGSRGNRPGLAGRLDHTRAGDHLSQRLHWMLPDLWGTGSKRRCPMRRQRRQSCYRQSVGMGAAAFQLGAK